MVKKKGVRHMYNEHQKPYHIGFVNEAGARCAILPGDPGRVEKIATHLTNPRFVAQNREYTTWVGEIEGEPVYVMSTGMGGPSAAIGIEELRDQIRGFAAAGTTVIVSSHILSEVQQMADTIGIIYGGRLAYEDALRPGQDLEELFMSVCREGRRARGEVAA